MNESSKIDRYAARLLMMSFFLPEKAQEVSVMLTGAYFVFRSFQAKQPVPKRDYLLALLIGSMFWWYLGAVPMTLPHDRAWLLLLCQRKASIVLLPFAFALMGWRFRQVIIAELPFFAYGCVVSCICGNAGYLYHHFFSVHKLQGWSHVDYRLAVERITGIHPTYLGMFITFAISILLYAAPPVQALPRWLKYVLFYWLLLFLLAILAKAAVIALVIILLHFGYTRRSHWKHYLPPFAGLLAAVAAAIVIVPFVRQRIMEVISFAGVGKPGDVTDNSVYARKMIVDTDVQLLHGHWLMGVGPARLPRSLQEIYFFHSLYLQDNIGHYDPHNQYFYEWLSFGILGLLFFAAILMVHIVRAMRTNNRLYMAALLILYITFFTETLLSRQQGVLFYAVFTSLFFFVVPKKSDA